MAFSRKALKAMGLTEEQVETLVDMHVETVDGLKAQISTYKADADKLAGVQKELNEANAKLKAADTDGFKSKYEAEHKAFEDYKTDVENKATAEKKTEAYRALLTAAGLKGDKLIDAVIKGVDMSTIELDEKGIKDADKITADIKKDWADYISTEGIKKADVKNPPDGITGKTYTMAELKNLSADEINKNWDSVKTTLNGRRE